MWQSKLFLLLLLFFVTGKLVYAQSSGATTGALVGTITDTQERVIVGASITARHLATNLTRNTQVEPRGSYKILQLPPGDYLLTAQANPLVKKVPGDPVATEITGHLDPSRGPHKEFKTAFDSYYHAFTLTLERQLSRHFSLLAHYTFSKTIDNFNDFSDENFADSLRPVNDRSLSNQDARNRFICSAVFDLDNIGPGWLNGIQLSTIVTLNSGRPYDLNTGVDLNNDGQSGDRPNGIGRNAGITSGRANTDLHLSRTLKISERASAQFIIETFNLFNRFNFIAPIGVNFSPDAQGNFQLPPQRNGRFILPRERITDSFPARVFQLGFRLCF